MTEPRPTPSSNLRIPPRYPPPPHHHLMPHRWTVEFCVMTCHSFFLPDHSLTHVCPHAADIAQYTSPTSRKRRNPSGYLRSRMRRAEVPIISDEHLSGRPDSKSPSRIPPRITPWLDDLQFQSLLATPARLYFRETTGFLGKTCCVSGGRGSLY